MSGFKPLAIDLAAKDFLPAQFAADAADVLKDNDRVEVEPTPAGLVLYAVWEFDMEHAIEELREVLGLEIEHGPPQILYREQPRLLEPIMRVRLSVPEDSVGEVIGALSRCRAMVKDVEGGDDGVCRVDSLVPLANIFGRSYIWMQLTKGEAKIDVDFHGYEPVPPHEPEPDPSQPSAVALSVRRTV